MTKRFLLRIDQKLWNDIERWAQQDLRSVNGQIEFLLRDAVAKKGRGKAAAKAIENEEEEEEDAAAIDKEIKDALEAFMLKDKINGENRFSDEECNDDEESDDSDERDDDEEPDDEVESDDAEAFNDED